MSSRILPMIALSMLAVTSLANAGVPDPTRSSCTFPAGPDLACPGPVTVSVVLRDAFDIAVANCPVEATLSVLVGSLAPGQLTLVTAVTNASGAADLEWPTIYGNAQVTITLTATCVGPIQICHSDPYTVSCTDPTTIDPESWGRVKDSYR
ncbi:MAG: hypothetical protein R3B81_09065 [bacterium]